MGTAEWRVLERHIRFDQRGVLLKVEWDHGYLILHQDAVRLLEIGCPQGRVHLAQLEGHQFPIAGVVPAGVLEAGIGVEYDVEDVVGIPIVHIPAQPVAVVRAGAGVAVTAIEQIQVGRPVGVDDGDRDGQIVAPLVRHLVDE